MEACFHFLMYAESSVVTLSSDKAVYTFSFIHLTRYKPWRKAFV